MNVAARFRIWTGIFLLLLGIAAVGPGSLSFVVNRFFAVKVRAELQKSLSDTGLELTIGDLRLTGWDYFTGSDIILKDRRDGSVPLAVAKVAVRFDLLSLLRNPRHPESSLREIDLTRPAILIRRFSNHALNIGRYFNSDRELGDFRPRISISRGFLKFEDYQYGNHRFHQIGGVISLGRFPTVRWNIKGNADLNSNLSLQSQGEAVLNRLPGKASLRIHHIELAKLKNLLTNARMSASLGAATGGISLPGQVLSGTADLKLNFFWNRQGLALSGGTATVSRAVLVSSGIRKVFITKLQASFSPERFDLQSANLQYGSALAKATGNLNLTTKAVHGVLDVHRLGLIDLTAFMTEKARARKAALFAVDGLADIRLEVGGTVTKPVFSGEGYIMNATCTIRPRERVTGISGRLSVRRNQLFIQRLEGYWRGSLVGITGRVADIFHPQLDLQGFLRGTGAGLNRILNAQGVALQATGRLSLKAHLRGDWQNPRLEGELAVDRVEFQNETAKRVQASFTGEPTSNHWRIRNLNGEIWQGRFSTAGELQVMPDGLKWKGNGRLTGIQLKNIPFQSDLNISGSVDADAVSEGVWHSGGVAVNYTAKAFFKGQNLICRGAAVDEATGIFSFQDGTIKVETLRAKMGEGSISGSLLWNKAGVDVDLGLRNISLQQLISDSKHFISLKDNDFSTVAGVFDGNMTVKGNIPDLTVQVTGDCSKTVWNGKNIGTFTGGLTYADNRIRIQKLAAKTDFGLFNITGGLDLGSQPTLQLTLNSQNVQLKGIVRQLPLNPQWNVDGFGTVQLEIYGPLTKPAYRGNLSMVNPSLAGVQLDRARLEFLGDTAAVEIVQLQLFRRDSRIEMAGKIGRDQWDLRCNGEAVKLDLLNLSHGEKTLTGTLDFRAHISGRPTEPQLTASIQGRDIGFGTWKYDRLEADLGWDDQGIVFNEARLIRADSAIEIHGHVIPAQKPSLDLTFSVNSCDIQDLLQFTTLPKVITTSGKVAGLIKLTGPYDNPTARFTGNLDQGFINSVAVTGYFDLFYQQGKIVIQKIELNHEKGLLTARGVWENLQTLKIQAKLTDFPLKTLNFLFKQSFQAGGTVNSNLSLELSAARIFGSYQVDIKDCAINDTNLGNLSSEGEFSDRGLMVDSGHFAIKSGSLTVTGYFPWPEEWLAKLTSSVPSQTPNDIDLSVALKNIPAGLINTFEKKLTFNEGELNGNLTVSGSLTYPKLNGQLDCNNLQFHGDDLPAQVEAFQATVILHDNQARFDKATGKYGAGNFNIAGTASYLERGIIEYQLEFAGTKLYYKNSFFDGYGDLNFKLSGNSVHPLLTGTITASNGKVGIPGSLPPVTGQTWNPNLDLQLIAGDHLRFRQPGLADLTLNGGLQIKGSLFRPVVDGAITSDNGMITFYGRTFKVNQAKAVFTGSKGFNPDIEVDSSLITATSANLFNPGATGEVEIEVFLEIHGQVGGARIGERSLNATLRSQPYLAQSKIYALLNWPDFTALSNPGEANSDQPLTVNGVVTGNISFITDTMFGDLFYDLRRALNVDYLYLEQNYQTNDFRLNIGNKLNDHIFLSYSRSFAENANDNWNINYRFNPNWNFGGTFNQDNGAFWRLLYQISF